MVYVSSVADELSDVYQNMEIFWRTTLNKGKGFHKGVTITDIEEFTTMAGWESMKDRWGIQKVIKFHKLNNLNSGDTYIKLGDALKRLEAEDIEYQLKNERGVSNLYIITDDTEPRQGEKEFLETFTSIKEIASFWIPVYNPTVDRHGVMMRPKEGHTAAEILNLLGNAEFGEISEIGGQKFRVISGNSNHQTAYDTTEDVIVFTIHAPFQQWFKKHKLLKHWQNY